MKKRAAIIDTDNDTSAAGYPCDSNVAWDRQSGVSRCHRVHVVSLTIGSRIAMEFLTVPRCHSAPSVGTFTRVWHVAITHYCIRTVGASRKWLDSWHSIRNGIQIGRWVAGWTIVHVIAATATATSA